MDGFCVLRKRKLLDVFVLLTNNGNHTSVPSITSNNGLNKAKTELFDVGWLNELHMKQCLDLLKKLTDFYHLFLWRQLQN